jgi:hypothetical protein
VRGEISRLPACSGDLIDLPLPSEGQIWKIPASGGDAVQVTNILGYAPLESPDGAYLY